ncbi:hypothetical protein RHMOL_Rhmol04G0273400 [Rhododendron molle]|uniref:Uncharacterized protein n=1 Tax=Rhododendron molle TaxID=49168 RepID=A0ACC0P7B3_RHOML|nr:hypothetical protein RHMOL_Rhmol04G0273400 [Rhododendron molle]
MASPPKSLTASKFSVDFVVAPKSRSPDRTLRTRARFLKLCELRTGVGCYSRVLILSYSAYVLLYNLHVGYGMRDDVRKVRGTDERKGPRERREDKELLSIIQERGISDWIDIAILLGTNRTPFQCLARYQRSLNASILKREWTEVDDDKLRAAVETFRAGNWQLVASTLEGRTGTQCSN